MDMEILRYEKLTGIISEFDPEELTWLNAMPKEEEIGQHFRWDIYGVARDVGKFAAKHSVANRRPLTKIGTQSCDVALTFDEVHLPATPYQDTRTPGTLDRAKLFENQVARHLQDESDLMDRQDNFMIAQAMQGSLTITVDDLPVTIDYKIPTTNKFKVGGGAGFTAIPTSWADQGVDLIEDIKNFKIAGQRASGRSIKFAKCSSTVMGRVINSDQFKEFFGKTMDGAQILKDGYMTNFMGMNWKISDEVFEDESGTLVPYLDEKTLVLSSTPDVKVAALKVGSVVIPGNGDRQVAEVIGKASYADMIKNPVAIALYSSYARLPAIKRPGAFIVAKVIS